ncbi:MAG: MFS transporter [Promethearchaeota archaeon]
MGGSRRSPGGGKLVRQYWSIFVANACVGVAIAGAMLNMVEFSKIIWQDDRFHALEIGLLFSLKTWSTAFAGLLVGYMVDRHGFLGRKAILVGVLVLMGLGRFANGFASTSSPTMAYWGFVASWILFGFAFGGLGPTIISFTNDSVEYDRRSQFFGMFEAFGQVSRVLGMLASAWLVQSGYWRQYFWTMGAVLLVAAGLVAATIDEPKRGAKQEQLAHVLAKDSATYDYKLTRETIRSTMFSPTNVVAFLEGIFTWMIFSIALYLLYPYLQSPPNDVTPVTISLLMLLFGFPGAVFGALVFGRLSDRLSKRNIVNRIYLIVFSIVTLFASVIIFFFLPMPSLNAGGTENPWEVFGNPLLWVVGLFLFLIRAVLGIYNINQPPVLQKINLPEAQGTITSWNQFLETIGNGLGPLVAGIVLTSFNSNYQLAAVVCMLLGLPGAILWLLATRWIQRDIDRVAGILDARAAEIDARTGGD